MSPHPASNPVNSPPVEGGEFLLRRCWSEPGEYYATNKYPRFACLLPNSEDTDGISLYREGLIDAESLLGKARTEKVRRFGGVIALLAHWFTDFKFTIKPSVGDQDGHVSVVEMNFAEYKSRKRELQQIADALLRMAVDAGYTRKAIRPIPDDYKSQN